LQDETAFQKTKRSSMQQISLTLNEATKLIERIEKTRERGGLFNVLMPNGKRLRDCTRTDLEELIDALERLSFDPDCKTAAERFKRIADALLRREMH
jgi:hypothetical protein